MTFTGVSVDTLLEAAGPKAEATHALAFCHTGYTTNLPLADLTGGKAWVAWAVDGRPRTVRSDGHGLNALRSGQGRVATTPAARRRSAAVKVAALP